MLRNRIAATLVCVTLSLGAFAGACAGESLSPEEALAASGGNFGESESFLLRFHITTDTDEFDASTEGEIAYLGDVIVYSKMFFPNDESEQQLITENLFLPPNLYMATSAGAWYVLSPWDQGIPRDELPERGPDELTVDYEEFTGQLSSLEQLEDDTIDDEAYLRYVGTIDNGEHSGGIAPIILGPLTLYTDESSIEAELWLHKKTYLPRKMRVSERFSVGGFGRSVSTHSTFEFLDYGEPVTVPEPPADARPWRDLAFHDAPCSGPQLTSCLEAQSELLSASSDSCAGAGKRICLVPLGQISPALVQHLGNHYRDQYGLTITVLTPHAVPGSSVDPLREQVGAEMLIDHMEGIFPEAYRDPNVVLIAITPVDVYWEASHFRYVFGVRNSPEDPKAVISTFRMMPETYGEPPNDDLLFSRARKLLSKYIGILFYGLSSSPDPQSPLYDSILGPDDLDRMGELLPVQP
jgi:archaemetzincin